MEHPLSIERNGYNKSAVEKQVGGKPEGCILSERMTEDSESAT